MAVEIIQVLFAHFVGDFILQSDWMAQNKSKKLYPLCTHVTVYSLPLYFWGWKFALANAGMHFCIDFVTSRISSRLWAAKQVHWFFVVIGFDQFLHAACLILTFAHRGTP